MSLYINFNEYNNQWLRHIILYCFQIKTSSKEIDPKSLITFIEAYPILWDKTSTMYED